MSKDFKVEIKRNRHRTNRKSASIWKGTDLSKPADDDTNAKMKTSVDLAGRGNGSKPEAVRPERRPRILPVIDGHKNAITDQGEDGEK